MATLKNNSDATLVMPDGTEVAHGQTVKVDKKTMDHPAIVHWLGLGWLIDYIEAEVDKLEGAVDPASK